MVKMFKRKKTCAPEKATPPKPVGLRLMAWGWRALIAVLALMVMSVGLGRLLFSSLPLLQSELTRLLSDRLHADFHIESMSAQWNGGEPLLALQGLSLKGKDASVTGFSIGQLNMALDLKASLFNWTPVFSSLTINGVNIELVQGDGASWALAGIDRIAGSSLPDREHQKGALLNWLALQQTVDINDIRLYLRKADGGSSEINGHHLTVSTGGEQKKLSARLEVGSGFVVLAGHGVISQGTFFGWEGSLQANALDAEQLCVLWGGCHDNIMAVQIQLDTLWRYDRSRWQLAGQVALPKVVYLGHGGRESNLSARTDLFMQGTLDHDPIWQVWLNDLELASHLPDGAVSRWQNSWYLAGGYQGEDTVTVASKTLHLDLMKQWALDSGLLPEEAAGLVHTLNPGGQLNDLAVRLYPSRKPFDFDLSAELDDVSVDAWHGAPSGRNVSGPLRMSLLQGYLDLDTEGFQLGFPKLFRHTWTFNTAKARLYWDVVDDYYILRSDDIALTGPKEAYKGKLRLDVPLRKKPGDSLQMALTVGLSHGNAGLTSQFLPTLLPMSESLTHWLDTAIRQGDLSGGFIYNGALTKVDGKVAQEDARWGLFFDISNGQLDYSPDWPALTDLNARVLVNDDRVEVLGKHARTAGAELADFVARTPLHGDAVLDINTQLKAGGESLQHFLTQTPINGWLSGAARSWRLTGKPGSLNGSLNLSLPMHDLNDTRVDIRSTVQSFRFAIPDQGIDISNIDGDLSFSSERGLVGRQLSGTLFGYPSRFGIRSVVVNNKPVSTDIDWTGQISAPALQRWLKQDWLALLHGKTDYHSRLSIGLKDHTTVLRVNSQLLGISTDLPAPLKKVPSRAQALDLTLRQTQKDRLLDVSLEGLGHLVLGLTPTFSPSSARITLGRTTGNSQRLPGRGSIVVNGALPELDMNPWQAFFRKRAASSSADHEALVSRLEIDQVRVGSLQWGQYRLSDATVSLLPALRLGNGGTRQKGTTLQVKSEALQGNLWRPVQQGTPWLLTVDHVYLPGPKETEKTTKARTARLAGVDPKSLPDIDVQVKKLQMGDLPPLSVAFNLRQDADGVRIDNIASHAAGMELTGLADWVQVDGEQHSWLQSRLRGPNLDEVLRFFNLKGVLQAQESNIASSINWAGPPHGVSVANLKGRVDLLLKKGSLNMMDDGSADALKLFGIFNIESLARRITLDFSDLYSSGVSFDLIKASLSFNRGVITFDEPMIIEGPSSDFKLAGTIDMNSEQLDLSLVFTLPLTSNLPILSVLLGTAPQVAGMIYIADKLLGKQVDQLTSIRYRIQGSFADPKMTLDRLFTNQPRKSRRQKAE